MSDDAGTGRWMTYDELAEVRGIKRIGAVRLVQRYKWRRQAGNDGRARVLVPHDALEKVRGNDAGIDAGAGAGHNDAGNAAGTINDLATGALAALETAVFSLTARAEQAEKGREEERQRAEDLRAQITTLTAELVMSRTASDQALAAERAHVGRLNERLTAADAAAKAAEERADALARADADRKGRGVLARLRAALRGE